jgi:hypothetical protein
MIDTIFDLLQGLLLPALVAGVISMLVYRYNEARQSRLAMCRQLRDLRARSAIASCSCTSVSR